jgi:hypothetical protein
MGEALPSQQEVKAVVAQDPADRAPGQEEPGSEGGADGGEFEKGGLDRFPSRLASVGAVPEYVWVGLPKKRLFWQVLRSGYLPPLLFQVCCCLQ